MRPIEKQYEPRDKDYFLSNLQKDNQRRGPSHVFNARHLRRLQHVSELHNLSKTSLEMIGE
jgi:hypothetical protein